MGCIYDNDKIRWLNTPVNNTFLFDFVCVVFMEFELNILWLKDKIRWSVCGPEGTTKGRTTIEARRSTKPVLVTSIQNEVTEKVGCRFNLRFGLSRRKTYISNKLENSNKDAFVGIELALVESGVDKKLTKVETRDNWEELCRLSY